LRVSSIHHIYIVEKQKHCSTPPPTFFLIHTHLCLSHLFHILSSFEMNNANWKVEFELKKKISNLSFPSLSSKKIKVGGFRICNNNFFFNSVDVDVEIWKLKKLHPHDQSFHEKIFFIFFFFEERVLSLFDGLFD
jgi:hypothetical protein